MARKASAAITAVAASGATALALVALGLFESRRLHVIVHEFPSSRLPCAFDGVRLVFITDVHAGPYFGERQMRRLVERVNSLEPDIIVLGGDNVGGGSRTGARVFYPAASGFEAPLGKFAVLGNHDVWEGESVARAGLLYAGFTVLDNSSALVERGGETIAIAGLADLRTGRPDAGAAAEGLDGRFAVLVTHNPDVFDTALTTRCWDLALAGHTHGGQVTLFGKHAPIVPSAFGDRYRTGWRTEHGTRILVSNGIGTVTAPVRLFARPQLHVIDLASERP